MQITLPNGSIQNYSASLTVLEIAKNLSDRLANSAIAAFVDNCLVDLSYSINTDCKLTIITDKDPDALKILRHSTAHLLAYAVKQLFPEVKMANGPVIENGFYYDFSYHRSFTEEDLKKIENCMIELAKKNEKVLRYTLSRNQAISYFQDIFEIYKIELIHQIPEDKEISFYSMGNFIDLCRGPHVPSTEKLKVFKLMSISGAYWKGDSKRKMLQRIYGTAWFTQKEQEKYLHMLDEAIKRDHRKIGKQLDFFHLQEEGPGVIFWHRNGWLVWQQIERYMRNIYRRNEYQEVKTPQILDFKLWKKSGHWDNYKDNMLITELENNFYALKPMNCPGHIQIFNTELHSYRELPIRYAEFGQCHRNETSGALHGLMRVRGFTQDDGHIFCTEEQILEEVKTFNKTVHDVYRDFGFTKVAIQLALRPIKRVGHDDIWDKAENALRDALSSSGFTWNELSGEGAFYGPKIDYYLKDSIGRDWQCGTIQIDFSMPVLLGAEYVTSNNTKKTPVMLHRAILGSLERFIGILIENYSGALPTWLSPIQCTVMNISKDSSNYAKEVTQILRKHGFRIESDLRNEKIAFKIRENTLQKVPYFVIVGKKEQSLNMISVRSRSGIDFGVISIDKFVNQLQQDISQKGNL